MLEPLIYIFSGCVATTIFIHYVISKPRIAKLENSNESYINANEIMDKALNNNSLEIKKLNSDIAALQHKIDSGSEIINDLREEVNFGLRVVNDLREEVKNYKISTLSQQQVFDTLLRDIILFSNTCKTKKYQKNWITLEEMIAEYRIRNS